MWKHINEILYNKVSANSTIKAINNSDGNITTNVEQIANTFNVYFRDVGKTLYENLTVNNFVTIPSTTNRTVSNSMVLWNTSEEEVLEKIACLKNSKSSKDIISSAIIKQNAILMAPLICKFTNRLFENGSFPSKLKCSRIVPIYKDGNPLHVSNYRPISILPAFSKIIESLLCDRLNAFLSQHNVINENQFGFQKNSGALSAAATMVDFLQTKIDEKKNTTACCVFIDLKKAFDTISHSKLLEKLNEYGIRGTVNSLIASYLSNRAQFVDINDSYSDTVINENQFGLPQGSNLGPLLFLIYINGIFNVKLNGTLYLFADDSVLVYTDTDIESLQTKIQNDLDALASWFLQNKLTLNENKTKFMLIKPSHSTARTDNFGLSIDSTPLQRVKSFKYLGINIQENLKWNCHIDIVCGKLAGVAGAAKRLGNRINPKTRISFYYAMCNSYLTYLAPIWSTSITRGDTSKLQIAQNYAIRTIFAFEYNVQLLSTQEILKAYKILGIDKLMLYNNHIMMYKIENNLMKCNHIINRSQPHNYNTRNANLPRLRQCRTSLGQRSIFRACTEHYRSLPPYLTNQRSLQSFKKKLKLMLLSDTN